MDATPDKFCLHSHLYLRILKAAVFQQQPGTGNAAENCGPQVKHLLRELGRIIKAAECHVSLTERWQRGYVRRVRRRAIASISIWHAQYRFDEILFFSRSHVKSICQH